MIRTIFFIFLLLISACSNKIIVKNGNNNHKEISKNQFPYFKKYKKNDINLIKEVISKNNDNIMLLSRNDVLNLLGEPIIIKSDSTNEIWQYRENCILNIIWERNNSIKPNTDSISENLAKNIKTIARKKNKFNYPINTELKLNSLSYKIIWIEAFNENKKRLNFNKCFIANF